VATLPCRPAAVLLALGAVGCGDPAGWGTGTKVLGFGLALVVIVILRRR
jgi:hypothetical protein